MKLNKHLIRERVKKFKEKFRIVKRIKLWYQGLKQEKQKQVNFFLNYIFNSVPISITIYIVSGIWLEFTFSRLILTYIATLCALPYFEYYTGWDKE